MSDNTRFATDLYQGTADYYERYRLPYPAAMIAALAADSRASGNGRLLDLACGTGQLAFPLSPHFTETWAVDQESDMVAAVRAKAESRGIKGLRSVAASAETLDVPPGHFELAVVGNAFHRLPRDVVARRLFGWLAPGGRLALCWSMSPWAGELEWQRALAAVLRRWQRELGAQHRASEDAARERRERPDVEVLAGAGFVAAGRREFAVEHQWTLDELAGHVRSTSFLPPSVLGARAAEFDADLAASLGPHGDSDSNGDRTFPETVSFAYDLLRKPS